MKIRRNPMLAVRLIEDRHPYYYSNGKFQESSKNIIVPPESIFYARWFFQNNLSDVDLTDSACWGDGQTGYAVAANRAGKNFAIVVTDTDDLKLYDVDNIPATAKKVAGFYCSKNDIQNPPAWTANTLLAFGDRIQANGGWFRVAIAGKGLTGGTEPVWNNDYDTQDGSITWQSSPVPDEWPPGEEPSAWQSNTLYETGDLCLPGTLNGYFYEVIQADGYGKTGGVEPVWPENEADSIEDNGLIFIKESINPLAGLKTGDILPHSLYSINNEPSNRTMVYSIRNKKWLALPNEDEVNDLLTFFLYF